MLFAARQIIVGSILRARRRRRRHTMYTLLLFLPVITVLSGYEMRAFPRARLYPATGVACLRAAPVALI